MSIEAMKQALEALEPDWELAEWYVDELREKAITSLRQAIAEAENKEAAPVAKNEGGRITWLVDDWPANCLLYAEPPKWTPVEIGVDVTSEGAHVVGMYVLMPEAVRHVFYSQFHPAPQRQWVGLTDDEMRTLKQKSVDDGMTRIVSDFEYIRSIEAKLKENNT